MRFDALLLANPQREVAGIQRCRRESIRGVPRISSVSRRSAAALVTATSAHAPPSNCSSVAAVSSTSRSSAAFVDDAPDVRGRTEQMQQDLEAMAAEVGHRTAAALRRLHQPVARIARRGIERLGRNHLREHRLADRARRDQLADANHGRVEVTVVGDAEPHAASPGRRRSSDRTPRRSSPSAFRRARACPLQPRRWSVPRGDGPASPHTPRRSRRPSRDRASRHTSGARRPHARTLRRDPRCARLTATSSHPRPSSQRLTDAFADDVARADQAPAHSSQGSGFRVQGSRFGFWVLGSGFRVRVQSNAEP